MSRTDRSTENQPNPAEMFFRWSSDDKAFGRYDKEKDGLVFIEQGTPFIVLDMLNTCTGYDEKLEAGLYSNEVRNLKTQVLRLFAGKKLIASGIWEDIKGHSGVKFAKSVYALAKVDDEYRLVNFKMSGAAVSAWFDFVKEVGGERKLYGDVVVAQVDSVEGKKGKVTYNSPVFKIVSTKLSDEAARKAIEADETLQEYLRNYFERDARRDDPEPADEPVREERDERAVEDEDLDSVPF